LEFPILCVPLVGVFIKIIEHWVVVELWYIFLCVQGRGSGSIVKLSASHSQDAGCYPLFRIRQEGLAAEAIIVGKL
jgi:hypothetical protein